MIKVIYLFFVLLFVVGCAVHTNSKSTKTEKNWRDNVNNKGPKKEIYNYKPNNSKESIPSEVPQINKQYQSKEKLNVE